jgi:hypothetical protein
LAFIRGSDAKGCLIIQPSRYKAALFGLLSVAHTINALKTGAFRAEIADSLYKFCTSRRSGSWSRPSDLCFFDTECLENKQVEICAVKQRCRLIR